MKFTLSQLAKSDLRSIAQYTEQHWGKAQRNRYIVQLDEAFQRIAQFPEDAQSFDAIMPAYFRYHCGRHYIFFRKREGDCILIARILHEKMDILRHLEKE